MPPVQRTEEQRRLEELAQETALILLRVELVGAQAMVEKAKEENNHFNPRDDDSGIIVFALAESLERMMALVREGSFPSTKSATLEGATV